MAHLSDQAILDAVKKVQPIQLSLASKGYCAHIDVNVHESLERHLSFDFTIFSGDVLLESFDFSAIGGEEELEEKLSYLFEFVKHL